MRYVIIKSTDQLISGLVVKWLTRRSAKPLCGGSNPPQASKLWQSGRSLYRDSDYIMVSVGNDGGHLLTICSGAEIGRQEGLKIPCS